MMGSLKLITLITAGFAALALLSAGCRDHPGDHAAHNGSHNHEAQTKTRSTVLAPAEGAKIKILTPANEQIFTGDEIPLHFELIKGKRGEHVHAYVDGEMAGMFKSTKGTLTGIQPGKHSLELRVVTADHNTELDASDKVNFFVK
ncbi:MAG TPA: hypothetical protein VHM64_18445 [Candidatus Binatia bacterium]|nr:hypothetical protein [Candidatus Binatia bacterium]